MKKIEATVQPANRRIIVDPNLTAHANLRRHHIHIASDCGGKGVCGKCKIQFLNSAPKPSEQEKKLLTRQELNDGWRLACQTHLFAGAEISVPEQPWHLTETILTRGTHKKFELRPAVRKIYLELPPQTIEQPVSDAQLILNHLDSSSPCSFELEALTSLPEALRKFDHKVTVTILENRITKVEPGNTADRLYGVAIDVGTSTIVAALLDLHTGLTLGVAPAFNPQKIFGADVISRIQFCREHESGLEELNQTLRSRLEEMIRALARDNNLDTNEICETVAVGNPTMQHLFLGLNPYYIGEMPYTPVVAGTMKVFRKKPFTSAFWDFPVETPPNFSGFIGSDILAGIIAQDMVHSDETQLFIDIGTNAEIVVGNKHHLCVSNCAAGPAFEGAKIECGMSGIAGAIDTFDFDQSDIIYTVIGEVEPKGICGSGLVDIVAAFLEIGLVDETGRFLKPQEMDSAVPNAIKQRMNYEDSASRFHITDSVYVSQGDIRNLQAAKAAISAGIKIVSKRCGLECGKISKVIIAGAFGNYINPRSAQRIGLIPRLPLERVYSAGNTALEGAKMYLLSTEIRELAARIPQIVELYELANEPDFMNEYVEEMIFA